MANPQFDADEQAFLTETGLDVADLTALVKGASEVPADVTARVQQRVATNLFRRPRVRSRLWAAVAAAVAGIALMGTLVSTGVAAELVQQLYRLVPGFGIAETTSDTVVLAAPVPVTAAGHDMHVLGLVSNQYGTVVRMRWIGATEPKVTIAERPCLILPDGRRIQTPGGDSVVSDGTLTWNFTFGPLPAGTRSVQLELPPIAGITTQTITVRLRLTADTSGLALAVPTGNPAVELNGVRMSVPSLGLSQDKLELAVGLEGVTPDVRVDRLMYGVLEDDLGNSYGRSSQDSNYRSRPGIPAALSFSGPVRPGAKHLKLTVPGVVSTETGRADVSVAVGDLAVGSSLPMDQAVVLGPVSFRITQVKREAESQYRLTLAPGATPQGYSLWTFSTASPVPEAQPPSVYTYGTERIEVVLDSAPTDGTLTFTPILPQVYRPGPFVIEIPLP